MAKFDWQAAVSQVVDLFGTKTVHQTDITMQKNISFAFFLLVGLFGIYFLLKGK